MKKYLLSLLLVSCMSFSGYAGEQRDTVRIIDNAANVTVTKKGDTTLVEAWYADSSGRMRKYEYEVKVSEERRHGMKDEFPDDWGMDLPFFKAKDCARGGGKKGTRRYVTVFRHIYWGWRFNYDGKSEIKNCFELGIRDIVGVKWCRRGAELEIGAGLGMKRFLANDGFMYSRQGDAVTFSESGGDIRVDKSHLDIFQVHVPVLYNQKICRELTFSIGGIANFNTYAGIYTRITEGDTQRKTTCKGLQQNFFTPEVFASLNLCGVGIYGSWSPSRLFKGDMGPGARGLSIGVDLAF